ncbi:hypothetical protein AB0D10_42555 [Kitasatospora sp. NPDC048545]|uniref:hypothetical protein n=1 Tax=Kitasatospora sp. NPDC048545 TaxID=3157208 RepID=UPI0033E388DB
MKHPGGQGARERRRAGLATGLPPSSRTTNPLTEPIPEGDTALFAIDRDARIAAHRELLHERSQTLANVPAGSRAHARTLAECEAISDEIERLKGCIDIPRSVVAVVPVLLFVLVLALIS